MGSVNEMIVLPGGATNWGDLLNKLNQNFSTLGNSYVYKGDKSEMRVTDISLLTNPSITRDVKYSDFTDTGKLIFDAIFEIEGTTAEKTQKRNAISSVKLNCFKTLKYAWWVDDQDNYIVAACPITYIDPEFSNGQAGTATKDYSCIVTPYATNSGYAYRKSSVYPTFYHDPTAKGGRGAWCWKINGVETGIIASAADETSEHSGKLFLMKKDGTVNKYLYYDNTGAAQWYTYAQLCTASSNSYKPLNNDLGYMFEDYTYTPSGSSTPKTVKRLTILIYKETSSTTEGSWIEDTQHKYTSILYDDAYMKYIWDTIASGWGTRTFSEHEEYKEHGLQIGDIYIDTLKNGDGRILNIYNSEDPDGGALRLENIDTITTSEDRSLHLSSNGVNMTTGMHQDGKGINQYCGVSSTTNTKIELKSPEIYLGYDCNTSGIGGTVIHVPGLTDYKGNMGSSNLVEAVNNAGKTVSVTYNELISLKRYNNLIPGYKYRITDYNCFCRSIFAIDADFLHEGDTSKDICNHRFDIIVTALNDHELSHDARACRSDDSDSYFMYSDLSKWILKYDIENDPDKYNWICESSKGLVLSWYGNVGQNDDFYFEGTLSFYDDEGEIHGFAGDKETVWYCDSGIYKFTTNTAHKIIGEWKGYQLNVTSYPFDEDDLYFAYDISGTSKKYSICVYNEEEDMYEDIGCITGYHTVSINCSEVYFRNFYGNSVPKGVIYYMKDDRDNEAGYDFKNIIIYYDQANPYYDTEFMYAFKYDYTKFINYTFNSDNQNNVDMSVSQFGDCIHNQISESYFKEHINRQETYKYQIPVNVILCTKNQRNVTSPLTSFNKIGVNSCYNRIYGNNNQIKYNCLANIIKDDNNVIGDHSQRNIITGEYNQIGKFCTNNTIVSAGKYNTIGDYSDSNKIGSTSSGTNLICEYNTIGRNNHRNEICQGCSYNKLEDDCSKNILSNRYSASSSRPAWSYSTHNTLLSGTVGAIGYEPTSLTSKHTDMTFKYCIIYPYTYDDASSVHRYWDADDYNSVYPTVKDSYIGITTDGLIRVTPFTSIINLV